MGRSRQVHVEQAAWAKAPRHRKDQQETQRRLLCLEQSK